MTWWMWIILFFAISGMVTTLTLLYRLREVRNAGTPVLFRELPAGADEGWRHGTVHYTDNSLLYYRLSSILPGPTAQLSRSAMVITERRQPAGTESEIMDDDATIVQLDVSGAEYELAMEPVVATAFLSWYEAASPSRSRRGRPA